MLIDSIELLSKSHTTILPGNYPVHKRMPADIEKDLLTAFDKLVKSRGIKL